MEVRVRERLIGALVLVAIVVLVVPAILKGRGPAPAEPPAPLARRVEMPLGDGKPEPVEQILVPEPELPGAAEPMPGPAPSSTAPGKKASPAPAAAAPRPAEPRPAQPAPRESAKSAAPVPTRARPQPSAAQPASAWAVQLGAFSNRDKAEQLVAELKKRRFAAFILEYRASGQVLYRVRVGPEQDRARAQEIASRLAKDGFQPVVARHP